MDSSKKQSQIVEAVFVYRATDRDIGQLWIPAKQSAQTCNKGLGKYKLGQWLLFDTTKKEAISAMAEGQEPYETRVYEVDNQRHDMFVQLKVPIIYFADKTFREVVAFSPQFGRIGSFYKQENVTMDKINFAWIAYMALYRDNDWNKLMKALQVQWVVSSIESISKQQIRQEIASGHCCRFVEGIVVNIEEQSEIEEQMGSSDGKSQRQDGSSETSTNSSLIGKTKMKFWTLVHIWTPELGGGKSGIAIHHIEGDMGSSDEEQRKLQKIGIRCKLMPILNWSNNFAAINPHQINMLDGISIVQTEPTVKLKICQNQYDLGPDSDSAEIYIPEMIGKINCAQNLFREIQTSQQCSRKTKILVEFANGQWKAIEYEEADNSPSIVIKSPTPNAQIVEQPIRTLNGGFGGGRGGALFEKYRTPKPILSTSSNVLSTKPTSSNAIRSYPDVIFHKEPSKKKAPPQRKNAKNGKNPPRQRQPSNSSLDSEEAIPRASSLTPPKKSLFFPYGDLSRTNRNNASSANRKPDFSQSNPKHTKQLDISGVVVSQKESGFYIFTPKYAKCEIFLPRQRATNVTHCSWLIFDAIEYPNGRVEVGKYRLQVPAPYITIHLRNTVQIKLSAMVPSKWKPKVRAFIPVVKTDFVEEVIDSKHLLDESFAGTKVDLVIERGLIRDWPKFTWFIAKIEM